MFGVRLQRREATEREVRHVRDVLLGHRQHCLVRSAVERADELSAIGSSGNIKNPGDGDCSFWYSYSAKGFYAYYWRVWDGP
jgi:hypothetical protein